MRLLATFLLFAVPLVTGQVVISEIADKGSTGECGANDWLELHNQGAAAVDLSGYILHDDNGPLDQSAFTFPMDSSIDPDEYLLLCTQQEGGPQFKIGGDDTLSLVSTSNEVVDSVGPLPDTDSAVDVSYALNSTDGSYIYTTTPTPGAANVLTPIVVETADQIKARLAAQNDLGTRFFGMDGRGFPVADAFDDVLDLFITMEEADYDYLLKNQSYEVYSPFTSARLATKANETLQMLTNPGRIRPRGQSTLYLSTCLGSPTIPFQLELNTVNETQALFGVEKLYLRNHLSDNSYMREWAIHRMLARFGLPHLRARKVRFHINGERRGFYTAMEAPDQEYVFARSFPDYDPSNHTLFKVKTFSIGCGAYSDDQLEEARQRINETTAPPYSFERGEHRDNVPVLGFEGAGECITGFIDNVFRVEFGDVVLAYVRANEQCGKMLVENGIIDRDLGDKEWEPTMESFIDENLANNTCDPGCTNSDLATEVDTEQFLKNFAVYAVTLNGDSPMGNGNNYYLAQTGDGKGWKVVQYDHNNAFGDVVCNQAECNEKVIYWSILRPTCAALETNQIVGPLLTNPDLHSRYIQHVASFVDTVLGNASFVEEMTQHAQAIQGDVAEDFWSNGGIYYENELSPNASEWNVSAMGILGAQLPLLPVIKARTAEVRAQLEALTAGTFPRGPHLEQGVEPAETCVDWRTTEAPSSACYESCQYDGCFMTDWIIPGFCDVNTSTCIHGDYDEQCRGIFDGMRYEGMENREDGRETFCINTIVAGGLGEPAKSSFCPPPPNTTGTTSPTTSAAYQHSQSLFLAFLLAVCFFCVF